jgi:hypothetical protein
MPRGAGADWEKCKAEVLLTLVTPNEEKEEEKIVGTDLLAYVFSFGRK